MPNFAKPIEQLLQAEVGHKVAMSDFAAYYDLVAELRKDMADVFPSPTLWAAINQLIEFVETCARAETKMRQAGFTTDDAFTWAKYEREEVAA